MLTGKEFRSHIFFLIGDHPYTWAKKKDIKRHVIDQLKRESIPGPKILNQLAIALGEDVNYLLSGKKTLEKAEGYVKEPMLEYGDPEEEYFTGKLLEILRNGKKEHRSLIMHTINTLCGDRRKKQVRFNGPDKRKKTHLYI